MSMRMIALKEGMAARDLRPLIAYRIMSSFSDARLLMYIYALLNSVHSSIALLCYSSEQLISTRDFYNQRMFSLISSSFISLARAKKLPIMLWSRVLSSSGALKTKYTNVFTREFRFPGVLFIPLIRQKSCSELFWKSILMASLFFLKVRRISIKC